MTTGRSWRSIDTDNFTNLLCQSAVSDSRSSEFTEPAVSVDELNCVNCILLKLRTLQTLLHHLVLLLGVCDALIPGSMKSAVQPNKNVENWNVVLVDHRLMTSLSQPGVRKFGIIAF